MRYVQKALYGLVYLRKTLVEYAGSADHALVRDWVDDVTRFAQTHQVISERAALHVHLSALLFSPHESWTYNTYKGLIKTKMPNVLSGIPKTWPTHQILAGHSGKISCLAFSPDGKRVVSGSYDETLRFWDADTGAQIGSALEGHSQHINCLAFSPDGKHVVSGSDDGTLRLWDVDTGAQIGGALEGHSGVITCLVFSPDGKRVVSGSWDRTLRLWDVDTGAQIGSALEGHSSVISCFVFSPDGKHVVSGSWDKTLRLWDVDTGAQIGSALEEHSRHIHCIAFSPDGKHVGSGSGDGTLRLWDVDTGTQVGGALEGHSSTISCLVFSPDGKRVVSVSHDETLRLWDVAFGGVIATVAVGESYFHNDPYFSSDNLSVCFEGRKWHVSRDGLTEHFGQIALSSGPPIFSPMKYHRQTRSIEICDMPEHSYFLPLDFSVLDWKARGGIMALGAEDGRVMIIDSTYLLCNHSEGQCVSWHSFMLGKSRQ